MTQPSDTPSPPPKANVIDHTNPETFNRFLSGIATAFANSALSRAFTTEIDNTPPPYPSPTINKDRILRHFTPGITNLASENAILLEAGDFSALAVWETTKYTGLPFAQQQSVIGPIRAAWREKVAALKAKHIGMIKSSDGRDTLKPHYHLGFLVRNPEVSTVPGAISAVIKPILADAVKEGVPVWLEATYDHAVAVYEHYGFRVVEVVTVGAGKRNSEGWPEEGGSGTRGWAMIFDGHLRDQVPRG